jgi:NTP pyrophosphatase (non-canonical NTP hydrolase)
VRTELTERITELTNTLGALRQHQFANPHHCYVCEKIGPCEHLPSPNRPIGLSELQQQVAEWHQREFRTDGTHHNGLLTGLVVCEEAGEVARCLAKRGQGIRGSYEHWTEELRKEIADVIIATTSLAAENDIDVAAAVGERWAVVGARKFASEAQ